jgi:hypothetical protein
LPKAERDEDVVPPNERLPKIDEDPLDPPVEREFCAQPVMHTRVTATAATS